MSYDLKDIHYGKIKPTTKSTSGIPNKTKLGQLDRSQNHVERCKMETKRCLRASAKSYQNDNGLWVAAGRSYHPHQCLPGQKIAKERWVVSGCPWKEWVPIGQNNTSWMNKSTSKHWGFIFRRTAQNQWDPYRDARTQTEEASGARHTAGQPRL